MLRDFPTICAAITTMAALLAEHLLLWRVPWRLSRPASYCVGTATVGGGYSCWAYATMHTDILVAFWIIATTGGTAVVTAYWVRSIIACSYRRGMQAGMIAATPLHKMRDDETPFSE